MHRYHKEIEKRILRAFHKEIKPSHTVFHFHQKIHAIDLTKTIFKIHKYTPKIFKNISFKSFAIVLPHNLKEIGKSPFERKIMHEHKPKSWLN